MSGRRLREPRYWLGIVVTVLSLAFLFRSVDFSRVAGVLGSVNHIQAALTLLTVALTITLKAIRWKILFQPASAQPSAARAISIVTIGQMINSVLPLRFGEMGRIYLTAELEDAPPSLVTATIVVEKTIDALMLLICTALVLPFVPMPPWLGQPVLVTAVIAFLAALLVFALARWQWGTRAALSKAVGVLPEGAAGFLIRHADIALQSLAGLGRPRVVAQVAFLTIVIWILAALTNYAAFLSLNVPGSMVAAVFLLIVLQVGVAIPSAPGRVGVFQALTVLGLSLFAIDSSTSLTYSIFLHVAVFLPPSAAGIVLLWHENSAIRDKRSRLSIHPASTRRGAQ